jgi:UDP-N-acetylmuramoylalanine--D-glutamate ligase
VIGITGSSGKTTTTALVGEILKASGYRTWVGGNIGTPLIDRVGDIAAGDRIVLELSSFQLQLYADQECPSREWGFEVGAILNITPNHLDRHPSMAHYMAAKSNVLRFGPDVVVLGADNAITGRWLREGQVDISADAGQEGVRYEIAARRVGFSAAQVLSDGAFLREDRLVWSQGGGEVEICRADDTKLLGPHNVQNLLAAFAISGAAGGTPGAMRQVATTFAGVPHRLELVRERAGVRWYNDSIATTPERVVAAIRSFDEPLILLAGGRDKHLPWNEMAVLALERVHHLVLFGEAEGLIAGEIEAARARRTSPSLLRVHPCARLSEAVQVAARVAQPGDVVLLSPGGTSFDAYRDFEERGEQFRALVRAL